MDVAIIKQRALEKGVVIHAAYNSPHLGADPNKACFQPTHFIHSPLKKLFISQTQHLSLSLSPPSLSLSLSLSLTLHNKTPINPITPTTFSFTNNLPFSCLHSARYLEREKEMVTDTAERKAARPSQVGAPPPEPKHLPCPRCDSTNTKFCYYNNYNFSQPRHFCKSCRRYWTHGGTLRDIPIGGGSRKNAKRSRTTNPATNGSATAFSSPHHDYRNFPAAASQLLVPFAADHGGAGPFMSEAKICGSFTSLLNTQGTGLWAMGGFGLGIGPGLDDVGFGLGRAVWPLQGVVEGGPTSGHGGGSSMAGHTWQLESGESGFSNGDCFALPDLAISTPGGSFMK